MGMLQIALDRIRGRRFDDNSTDRFIHAPYIKPLPSRQIIEAEDTDGTHLVRLKEKDLATDGIAFIALSCTLEAVEIT